MYGRRAPHVSPRREGDSSRPSGGCAEAAKGWRAARHEPGPTRAGEQHTTGSPPLSCLRCSFAYSSAQGSVASTCTQVRSGPWGFASSSGSARRRSARTSAATPSAAPYSLASGLPCSGSSATVSTDTRYTSRAAGFVAAFSADADCCRPPRWAPTRGAFAAGREARGPAAADTGAPKRLLTFRSLVRRRVGAAGRGDRGPSVGSSCAS